MLDNQPQKASSIEISPFVERHIGPTPKDEKLMLAALGFDDLNSFLSAVIPSDILESSFPRDSLPQGCSEQEALQELRITAQENQIHRSLIGLGYAGTIVPAPIQRQILENPSWYTAYTPYQAEISQGRLEALFNFQTLISELTGLPIANASLLDEATAAAEAMSLAYSRCNPKSTKRFLVDSSVLPQTLAVLKTRAKPLGITLEIEEPKEFTFDGEVFGILLQLPGCHGKVWDPTEVITLAHQVDALAITAIDPLFQVLMAPVSELGADIAVGSAQRLGIPMGFGGPHAAFFATSEIFKRYIPGRLVGQSLDAEGKKALRLALQTREQHIRRDKATSNICTAQVLLAVMASFYAIYHGPEGLRSIAEKVNLLRSKFESSIQELGLQVEPMDRFDTIEIFCKEAPQIHNLAQAEGFNFRLIPLGSNQKNATGFGVTFDELSNEEELETILLVIAKALGKNLKKLNKVRFSTSKLISNIPLREKPWLKQDVFHSYRSETELMRYIQKLSNKDFSLVHGMIPLGSCTMKLNATSELLPISWREFADLHPFVPSDQTKGYQKLTRDLEKWLSEITGFKEASLQPNAGSQGEFAGLLVIRAWHESRGEGNRNICLIPTSAHGTNPASSVMAGFKVVAVNCDQQGNVDLNDLQMKATQYSNDLAALMVTYPSTHGVFEPQIRKICALIHQHGGQVYLDGANLNAQVGLCKPGNYGADVCHLNLHKTFCIPHGGGGPGVGPIAVASHLVPFLPNHPYKNNNCKTSIGTISAAPWGSAGILPISWMYIKMMGAKGLRYSSSVALLSANFIAKKLDSHYPVLFKGINKLVAHECILDLRKIKLSAGIEVDDIAKRLMDYGFHAPTVSWPVAGTLMIEPTESESLKEIMRFCNAMIQIREEAKEIECGAIDPENNPLKKAPHSLAAITSNHWNRPYSREKAAFPMPDQLENKFWPAVSRINNAYGDRNLVCSCAPIEELAISNSHNSSLA